VRSEVRIVAEPGRLPAIHATGALAGRRTGPDTVHLIGTAAGPLGGDELEVTVAVAAGARLYLRSAASTLVLPGRNVELSTGKWFFEVGPDAGFDIDLEPTVVAGAAAHHVVTVVALADSANVRIRERVQLGRADEPGGRWRGELIADRDGEPLLRHTLELGQDTASADILAAPRALVGEFRYPDSRPGTVAESDAALLPLAGGGTLHTQTANRLQPEASALGLVGTLP
jgi:urease accessory protein